MNRPRSGRTSRTTTSPGRCAATSTQPPSAGAVNVVMNSDSPPSMLRFSDDMSPPAILASRCTPSAVAIIAPDSTLMASPPARIARATAKLGAWRTLICMDAPWSRISAA